MIDKDIIVTLENGVEYGVIETLIHEDIQYALLINTSNSKEIAICRVEEIDNDAHIFNVTEEEKEQISPLFYDKVDELIKVFLK